MVGWNPRISQLKTLKIGNKNPQKLVNLITSSKWTRIKLIDINQHEIINKLLGFKRMKHSIPRRINKVHPILSTQLLPCNTLAKPWTVIDSPYSCIFDLTFLRRLLVLFWFCFSLFTLFVGLELEEFSSFSWSLISSFLLLLEDCAWAMGIKGLDKKNP